MEKIKAALHIHDKTEVPGDGSVGNMQNPSSTDPNGPTATELWGTGNADVKHRQSHRGDTVAAAAAEKPSHQAHSQPAPQQDDPYSAARDAQKQTLSPSSGRGDENAIIAAELSQGQALPQGEKTLSPIDDPKLVSSIDPFRNEPEPSEETGPGSHFGSVAARSTPLTSTGQRQPEVNPGGHTIYYDKATGREGHQLGE